MHIVDDPIETVHLYVIREEPKRPYTALPLLVACLCLLAIAGLSVYSGEHPYYEHTTLTLPAQFLPPRTFTVSQAIIPTGVKTYPATTAHGTLTITNSSVISQTIPAGFTVQNVVTDMAVFVPAGNADGYGVATVNAHALISGRGGNLPPGSIDAVEGSSVYIRNLSPFTGGEDSYSVKYATAQDKQTALLRARDILLSKSVGLHGPCGLRFAQIRNLLMTLIWTCQFVQPPHIPIVNARITGIRLVGKNLVIDVMFIAQPKRYWAK